MVLGEIDTDNIWRSSSILNYSGDINYRKLSHGSWRFCDMATGQYFDPPPKKKHSPTVIGPMAISHYASL